MTCTSYFGTLTLTLILFGGLQPPHEETQAFASSLRRPSSEKVSVKTENEEEQEVGMRRVAVVGGTLTLIPTLIGGG